MTTRYTRTHKTRSSIGRRRLALAGRMPVDVVRQQLLVGQLVAELGHQIATVGRQFGELREQLLAAFAVA